MRLVPLLAAAIVAAGAAGTASPAQPAARPIIVASKPFGESYLLAEMFAQLLESRGLSVTRKPGLGATEVAFQALRTNAIDVYPEYTGTGLLVILGEQPAGGARAVFDRVNAEFQRRYGMRWLEPLGFENTYAIAVRRETAARDSLRTLTDLSRVASTLRAGLTPDFIGRADGLPALRRVYGFTPRDVRPLVPAVKYRALADSDVDVIDGYSTDGLIDRYNLVVLDDDRHVFPPYEAAAVLGAAVQRDEPRVAAALAALGGRIDVGRIRSWNRRIEVGGEDIAAVARDALRELGATGATGLTSRTGTARDSGAGVSADSARAARQSAAGIAAFMWARRSLIGAETARHLALVMTSLALAILVGLPLGLALERLSHGAETIVRAAGVVQTIPSIALLAFMIPLLGIGVVPALVALFLYSLYPILRNTYTGVRAADAAAVNAATAMGMTPRQVLRYVRLPLAAPIIMAGVRTAAVIDVGAATLAAFIGAGGLGEPIVSGLALADTRLILSGAVPAALLALVVDGALALVERAVAPGGRVGHGN
jgi:osmoprotectant transport system permease protein